MSFALCLRLKLLVNVYRISGASTHFSFLTSSQNDESNSMQLHLTRASRPVHAQWRRLETVHAMAKSTGKRTAGLPVPGLYITYYYFIHAFPQGKQIARRLHESACFAATKSI
jgi:hypothetical protein